MSFTPILYCIKVYQQKRDCQLHIRMCLHWVIKLSSELYEAKINLFWGRLLLRVFWLHGALADRSIRIIVESGTFRSIVHYLVISIIVLLVDDAVASPALTPTELPAVRRPRHEQAAAPWSARGGPRGRRTRPLTSRRPDHDFIYIVYRTTTLIPEVCGPLRSRILIRSVRLNTF